MIDYFALLQQPRRPWLDLENIKEFYHRLTIAEHPDLPSLKTDEDSPAPDFASVNEGYRVLLDPKLRLRHLLALEGIAPESHNNAPEELTATFLDVGALVHQIDRLLERSTTNALSKAVLRSEVVGAQTRANEALDKLRALNENALRELQELDQRWEMQRRQIAAQLSALYFRISHLGRWIEQLEERRFRLSIF